MGRGSGGKSYPRSYQIHRGPFCDRQVDMNADPKINLYSVPQAVINTTRDFLYRVGRQGYEGTGLWIGKPRDGSQFEFEISRFFPPEQVCRKIPTKFGFGVSVDLTRQAHLTLTDNLQPGERFYARVHSHPGRAYHSPKDNENPILTHPGAISIVV